MYVIVRRCISSVMNKLHILSRDIIMEQHIGEDDCILQECMLHTQL